MHINDLFCSLFDDQPIVWHRISVIKGDRITLYTYSQEIQGFYHDFRIDEFLECLANSFLWPFKVQDPEYYLKLLA